MSSEAAIRAGIDVNCRRAAIALDEIRVARDPYGGWRLGVISPGFAGLTSEQRERIVLEGLNRSEFRWVELLTPEEREWTDFFSEPVLRDVPAWPERLADASTPTGRRPSPTDDVPLEPPITAVFYSLRGGVGRSTTLASAAWALANRGRRVVCVDMDLEAPGLQYLFGVKGEDAEAQRGLVAALAALEIGELEDLQSFLVRVSEELELYLLPAGTPNAEYANLLRSLSPEAWYRGERNPIQKLFALLRRLPLSPDVILVDARTGFSPLNAPLVFEQADVAVVCLYPSTQAKSGTDELVKGLAGARTWRSAEGVRVLPAVRFVAGPVPRSDKEAYDRRQARVDEWVARWLEVLHSEGVPEDVATTIAYDESIALADRVEPGSRLKQFEPVADWLNSFLPAPKAAARVTASKTSVLSELDFSVDAAERLGDLSSLVPTAMFERAREPKFEVVLGRKGAGKTALFRLLDEREPSVAIFAPASLRGERRPWIPGPTELREVERVLNEEGLPWSYFWLQLVGQALNVGDFLRQEDDRPPRPAMNEFFPGFLELLRSHAKFSWATWLRNADGYAGAANPNSFTWLLFDGLDTGFGSDERDRARRAAAISGLFDWHLEYASLFRNLRVKIFLRDDLWRQARFENKSHYFARTIKLSWDDPWEYLRVVLQRANGSAAFRSLLPDGFAENVSAWSDEQAELAWEILVAPRMGSSKKKAWSTNWVLKRLADANNVRSPRPLLRLFDIAVERERELSARSPFVESILRPRVLEEALPEVSQSALSALIQEEFQELEELTRRLTQIGYTPFEASELRECPDSLVQLAREVGLLEAYIESDEQVERYRVPELYRLALDMKRRGQK